MSPRLRRFTLLIGWVIVLVAVAAYTVHTLKISTDLRSFMPPAQTADQKLLMEQIGEGPGSRLLLMAISGDDDERLAELSRVFSTALRKDNQFTQVVNGEFDAGLLDDSLLPYRYLLTSSFDDEPLDQAVLADELSQRVEDLGSPAATLLKPLLPRDPTLEVMKLAEQWSPPKQRCRRTTRCSRGWRSTWWGPSRSAGGCRGRRATMCCGMVT